MIDKNTLAEIQTHIDGYWAARKDIITGTVKGFAACDQAKADLEQHIRLLDGNVGRVAVADKEYCYATNDNGSLIVYTLVSLPEVK